MEKASELAVELTLLMIAGGRPCEWDAANMVLTIHSDDRKHSVHVVIADMDERTKLVEAACGMLDRQTFPERQQRFMDAARRAMAQEAA